MSYKTHRVNIATVFGCEDNGVWTTAPTGQNGHLDLVYIKTRNTPNNKVEVHIASGSSGYQQMSQNAVSAFTCEDNGSWQMVDTNGDGRADLVYIKTRNTGSGKAELHIASAKSNYTQLEHYVTAIKVDHNNDTWNRTDTWCLMPKYTGDWTQGDNWNRGLRLYHVRSVDTSSGYVEYESCYSLSWGTPWGSTSDMETSKFKATARNATKGQQFTMCEVQKSGWRYGEIDMELAFIDRHRQGQLSKTEKKAVLELGGGYYETVLPRRNTGVWQVVYHLISLGSDYATTTDLVHIKHVGTRSGKVELAIAAGNNIEDKDWVRNVVDIATKIPGQPVSKLKFWINAAMMDRDGIRPKRELNSRSDNAFVRIGQTLFS